MRGLGGAVVLLLVGVAWGAEEPRTLEPPVEPGAAAPETAQWLTVRDVHVEHVGNGRRITIGLSRVPDGVKDFTLNGPPRFVLDVRGPQQAQAKALTRFPVTDDVVTGVRVAANGDALRIVADLHQMAKTHHVRQEVNLLIADLGDTGASADAKDATNDGTQVAAAVPPAADAEAPKPARATKRSAKADATKGVAKAAKPEPPAESAP